MLLKDKVVLVTGGAGGRVGPGISRSLARHGAAVAVNYFTNCDKATALVQSFVEQGWTAQAWQCDVRDTDAVKQMVADIVSVYGRIDGVVNNAWCAGFSKFEREPEWDPDNWSTYLAAFESEVKATLNTIAAALPYMEKQGGGRIINICSEQWNEASGGATYTTSLAGRVALSRRLVWDMAAANVTINMIAPCATRDVRPFVKPWEERTNYERSIPFQRIADSEEIGDACAFFISDLAKFISGAYLQVNGGHHPQMGN